MRPAVIGFTGDGTGFLGGFTGRHSVPHPDRTALRWAGHLRWIEWTSTQARAHGAIWLNNGEPSDARGTFFPVAVTVRLFRPVGNVFTRLAMDYVFRGKATKDVRHARDFPPSEYTQGYWEW